MSPFIKDASLFKTLDAELWLDELDRIKELLLDEKALARAAEWLAELATEIRWSSRRSKSE